jgi:hypothetical protein
MSADVAAWSRTDEIVGLRVSRTLFRAAVSNHHAPPPPGARLHAGDH